MKYKTICETSLPVIHSSRLEVPDPFILGMAVWNSHIHEGNSACFLGRKVEPDGFVLLFGFSRGHLGDDCCIGTAATACQGRGILLNLQTSCRKCSNPSRGLAPVWAGRLGAAQASLCMTQLWPAAAVLCSIIEPESENVFHYYSNNKLSPLGASGRTLEDSRSHCHQLDAIRFWVMVGS